MADENGDGKKRNIDERLDALRMNLELARQVNEAQDWRIDKLMSAVEKLVQMRDRDAVDIGALARIAEAHEHRLENPDGGRG